MLKGLITLFIFLIAVVHVQADPTLEKATFAGGCFWCMESGFEAPNLSGIVYVISGYSGGFGESPTYEDYAQKGQIEVVQITYDPTKVKYSQLLDLFWRQIDPTDPGGQFVDRGPQYRSAVFYHDEEQKKLAELSKEQLNKSGRYPQPIVTEIISASTFYAAEDYHQNYHKSHPTKYKFYRYRSGRDQYLKTIWGNEMKTKVTAEDLAAKDNNGAENSEYKKPADDILKQKLSPLQYKVTQQNGTEPPFDNLYWNNSRQGIYVDLTTGEPLFSSHDKYDSGTGWPSFTKPLVSENIVEKEDNGFFSRRTEVRSKHGDSHLGHVFNDGPQPSGLRYCMNSAALRFIPREDLVKEGYGEFEKLFQ